MPIAPLESFMSSRGIRPAQLARESGYSRQYLFKVRTRRVVPSNRCIAAIVIACRALSGENVRSDELFDFDSEER